MAQKKDTVILSPQVVDRWLDYCAQYMTKNILFEENGLKVKRQEAHTIIAGWPRERLLAIEAFADPEASAKRTKSWGNRFKRAKKAVFGEVRNGIYGTIDGCINGVTHTFQSPREIANDKLFAELVGRIQDLSEASAGLTDQIMLNSRAMSGRLPADEVLECLWQVFQQPSQRQQAMLQSVLNAAENKVR
jgi:hypothetical protein